MIADEQTYFDRLIERYSVGVRVGYVRFPDAKQSDCHNNVDQHCRLYPGSTAVRGWLIQEVSWTSHYKCVSHSVIRQRDGTLIDVTPIADERERQSFVFVEHEGSPAQFDDLKSKYRGFVHPALPPELWRPSDLQTDSSEATAFGHMQHYGVGKCLNCGAPAPNRRSLYCGERCRQIAELVRYARRKVAEGTYDRPDIAEAITTRRSQLVVGFYDKRARQVTDKMRQELLARSKGRCEKCNRKFTAEGDGRFTVQHSATGKDFVLDAWCYRCNMKHAQSARIALTEGQVAFLGWFDFRVHEPMPALLCDDPDNWPTAYRKLQEAARHAA